MATTKKKPATRSTKKRTTTPEMRSFMLADETPPFFTFRITHQTVYWSVLCALVLALGVWVIYLNAKVQQIYDQIDRDNSSISNLVTPKHKTPY